MAISHLGLGIKCLGQSVLLFGRQCDVPEQQSIMLCGYKYPDGTVIATTYLVKGILDLYELLRGKSAWVNTLYFTSEVGKLGRVS